MIMMTMMMKMIILNAGDAGDDDDMVNAGPRKPTGKGCSKFMHVAPRVPLSPWISNVRTKSI